MSVTAAPTEQAPALGPANVPEPAPRPAQARSGAPGAWPERRGLWWSTLLLAGIVCLITFYAKGGLKLESMTATEMALTLLAGLVVAGALAFDRSARGAYGLWPLVLLVAFTGLTALSVVWSVQPDDSWHDASRMLAYSGVFAAAMALSRLAPRHWPALIGGLLLGAVVVCALRPADQGPPRRLPLGQRLRTP